MIFVDLLEDILQEKRVSLEDLQPMALFFGDPSTDFRVSCLGLFCAALGEYLPRKLQAWRCFHAWNGFLPWRTQFHAWQTLSLDASNTGLGVLSTINHPHDPKLSARVWESSIAQKRELSVKDLRISLTCPCIPTLNTTFHFPMSNMVQLLNQSSNASTG